MSRRKDPAEDDLFSRIQRIWLFSSCRWDELRAVAKATTEVHVSPGRVLAREGAPALEFLALSEGRAIAISDDHDASLLMPGSTFGEIALLGDLPLEATLETITECRLLVMDRRAFRALVPSVPTIGSKVMRELARRIPRAS